jgi:hypothetical protein
MLGHARCQGVNQAWWGLGRPGEGPITAHLRGVVLAASCSEGVGQPLEQRGGGAVNCDVPRVQKPDVRICKPFEGVVELQARST